MLLPTTSPPSHSRRRFVQSAACSGAALALARFPLHALAADAPGEQLIPFLDPQPIDPNKATLHWHELNDWITPKDQLFSVNHYGSVNVKTDGYTLDLGGLVDQPKSLTLDQLKSLPKKDVIATLECSGNGSSAKFMGAVGNAKWSGASLAALLKSAGISPAAVEVAFYGHDKGKEKIRGGDYEQHFARTLSIPDALRDDLILAYEMNGEPLTVGHGAPLRLIVPGWYGIAWVKWLQRIELRDHRLMTRFIAKDYVTLRGEELPDGTTAWKESSVGPMNLKSIVAKAVKRPDGSVQLMGAAWSGLTPVKAVEVQIDNGDWLGAKIDDSHAEPHTWRFWTFDWKSPTPGEHTLTSRAIDAHANIQPAADDPAIKLKKTYWEANQQWPRKIKL